MTEAPVPRAHRATFLTAPVRPNGGTAYVLPRRARRAMTTNETGEPWSSYRRLNHDLLQLQEVLDRVPVIGDTVVRSLDRQLAEARKWCAELVQQAETVETAAMVRALQYVDDTVMRDASVRAGNDENVVYTVSKAREDLRRLIDDCAKS